MALSTGVNPTIAAIRPVRLCGWEHLCRSSKGTLVSRGRGSSRTRRAGAMPGWVEETMAVITNPSPALEVALAYFDAWTHQDFDRAMTYIAENILCERAGGTCPRVLAPTGPRWRRSCRSAPTPRSSPPSATTTPRCSCTTQTVPVRPVPGAECVTVENGKTTRSWFVVTRPRSRSRNTSPHATRPSSHPLQDYAAPLAGRRRCRGVTGGRFGICLRSSCV